MCLAVPGQILNTFIRDQIVMAEVDFGGVRKEVCLEYIPAAQPGDYVIVHVGFAIQRLDEESALQTLASYRSLGLLDQEFADGR
jgi:hydrogenase expression/formation protein HypC